MSEGDVSLIRDEDVLRRMWQQTEDFSRKKEIRAHMYRLREERLRNLYSPEPAALGKGVESAMHVSSLADQSFQGLKSKEVRDAGSPPKDYRPPRADLKELSNAGWNVESKNRTTDDGHTQIRSVRADIEGKYDVEGGRGRFAAVDSHRQAHTEYRDDTSSMQRSEARADTAQREHVVRNTGDGTHVSSTTSSSTSSSKFQQVSSSTQQVPSRDECDVSRKDDVISHEQVSRHSSDRDASATREQLTEQVTNTGDYERNLRSSNYESAELVSRKVDYPDENTKVIVETRCLPDGTRVTSTRKEFRTPVHSTRSEQHSSRSESRSYSSQQRSDVQSSKIMREHDIVDSQRHADDYDFKKNRIQYLSQDDSQTQRTDRNTENKTTRKEATSKFSRESVERRHDVSESQTRAEDYSTKKDDVTTRRTNQEYETNVNKTNQQTDHSTIQRTNRYDSKVDETDRREIITTNDNQNIQRDVKETQHVKNIEVRDHNIKRDRKVEETAEKKTSDQYQTTYQTDYTLKKISNDWSPTHQAWASTLRGDTPASTRPTARASSPGSKTYQSSTSSLRSSVSPDKGTRKPSSRGSSPSKIDRSSPSRYSSDKYLTTQSTHSVTETKNSKHTSPERRVPTSPTRNRPSQSPEKRPSGSPDRKPCYKPSPTEKYPRTESPSRPSNGTPKPSPSPERRPYHSDRTSLDATRMSPYRSVSPDKEVSGKPKDVPFTRPSTSPERKPGYQRPAMSPSGDYPRSTSPSRPYTRESKPHTSPDRKGHQQPSPTRGSPEKANENQKDISPTRPSISPDRKPGYMRPTSASKSSDTPKYTSLDRKSPTKRMPSYSPERKPHGKTTIKEHHYKFIDEETKMYMHSDRDDNKTSPSPDRFGSPDDVPDYCRAESPSLRPTLRKSSRSPSPPKGPVTFTEDQIDKTENIKSSADFTTTYDELTKPYRLSKPSEPREPSPSKYGTYDKKLHTEETGEITLTTQSNSKDVKYDSLTRREKTTNKTDRKTLRDSVSPVKPVDTVREPSKFGTYDKKHHTEETKQATTTSKNTDIKYDTFTRQKSPSKTPDSPLSPTKKSPSDITSPLKSPTKDMKYKHTTDFISNERKTEEVPKKTTKSHPRQLITPSTSPTRKPKSDNTAPSTGQSSPTTSVSGFVYFSSPKTETTLITDIDDEEYYYETHKTDEISSTTSYKRPDSLGIERSPSPSKIPCRSPSPEKKVSPKESLPRKSSLKKPSNSVSPVEKPPSSFRISPDDETREFPKYKVVKKDNPEKIYDNTPTKSKPPFERRETYEERCLKILGVVDDKSVTTETLKKEPFEKSRSVSPCRSPASKEGSPFRVITDKKETLKTEVSDFLTREQVDTIKSTTTQLKNVTDRKSKTLSRDSSPTKLQDIISQKIVKKSDETLMKDLLENTVTKIVRESPDIDIGYQKLRSSTSPVRKTPNDIEDMPSANLDRKTPHQTSSELSSPDYLRSKSPSKDSKHRTSPERKPEPTKSAPKSQKKYPKEVSPTRSSVSPDRKPGYMRSTTATSKKYESNFTDEVREDFKSTTIKHGINKETGYQKPNDAEQKPSHREPSPTKGSPEKTSIRKSPDETSVSPDKMPGYMRPTCATITKFEETSTVENLEKECTTKETIIKHSTDKIPEHPPTRSPSPPKKAAEPKHFRTPSPMKKVTEDSTLLIKTEREQEVLDRVQQSLRKLSPTRDQRSPSREKSPGKTTISLQDIDVVTTSNRITEELLDEKEITVKTDFTRAVNPKDDKPKEQKPVSKLSRAVSPVKKSTVSSPTKTSPESPNKSRSISPKKPASPTERPRSPQISKASGIKPREPTPSSLTRKPSPGNISSPKITTTEVKKTAAVTKQNSFTKTTSTTKTTPTSKLPSYVNKTEPARAPAPKGINKENVSPKKDDARVTRTASDTSLKSKKTSPQRVKSKPEIQVNDLSPTRATKIIPKKTNETPSKLAPKPKSATALNTTHDDDDVIIDVEQAKSSRENSPDRICPTPVGFLEDIGTPRYPDEVSEPDDEFRKRTHHIIHETESIVDDIIEISEDEELFVKRADVNKVTESDECLLSVTDKVSKFTNKIETVTRSKDTTNNFKDIEKKVHSDFIDENLKTDQCLLTVSEKVNKFAKGPRDTKDKSPSRRIVDEYDTQTTYQDDYTKLSVNDKAHLFVETAESSKVTKTKPAQKVERPDLTDIDDSLKSDDCLLSVSDKVNKFVKTAEQFLTETRESEDKEKAVREQYDEFIKHIVQDDREENTDVTTKVTESIKQTSEDKTPSFAKETTSSHTKVKNYASPNLKTTERIPTVKITTLRSSEAVKKAKALFENIASTTQQAKDSKTTKLLDIGVIKKSPKTDSTIVLHPSVEEIPKEPESEEDVPYSPSPKERPSSDASTRSQPSRYDHKPLDSTTCHNTQSPDVSKTKSPVRQTVDSTTTTTKTVLSKYPVAQNEPAKRVRPDNNKLEKQTEKTSRRTPEPTHMRPETEKPQDKVPSYQRPTKTSQIKEEKTVEETEVTTRRGSGKFGVELRRTSLERVSTSSERRRGSDHHQPCIEDIFDLDLLEQMLEKVVGYEQRRRIRAQIRVAKKMVETDQTDSTYTKTKQTTVTKTRSPERRPQIKSPEGKPTPKTFSPEPYSTSTPQKTTTLEHKQPKDQTKPLLNGHAKEALPDKRQRPYSPDKTKAASKTKSPARHPSPEKKVRTTSPTKVAPSKPKSNRFSEYATAYMKKVGLNETDKVKLFDKTKRITDAEDKTGLTKTVKKIEEDNRVAQQYEEHRTVETKTSISKSISERTTSKDRIEIVQVNGHQAKRSPSPQKKHSPERPVHSPSERLYQRSPSPDFKRRADTSKKETIIKTFHETEPRITKKETIIRTVYEQPKIDSSKKEISTKTVYDIEKKVQPKQLADEKPSWVMNRNLKKITSESRSFSSKKVDEKKPRAASPSKALVRPTDAITSSYGPGPLDADGRPLFGIKALRNGATNYQVKGTVIRQEFHSRNGGEPEGTVSVTAYSTEPDDLERLLQCQGEKPSRLHGLAAITTTKKFGGGTGTTLKEAHSKEERAALEHFTHNERRVCDVSSSHQHQDQHSRMVENKRDAGKDKEDKRRAEEKRERVDRREDKKTVRQSSVKSLTEKYIKSANDTVKSERSAYPKAGLILRSANIKDSVSSDSSQHAGLGRADSAHSLGSVEDSAVVTRTTSHHTGGHTTTHGSHTTTHDNHTITQGSHTTTHGSHTTTSSRKEERSFLDSSTKVSGVQDILTRMKNADIVIQEGDSAEDSEARALLNKFLGASVLMAGMQAYVTERPQRDHAHTQETVRSSNGDRTTTTTTTSSRRRVEEVDLDQCWDEGLLRKLLEESSDYEQRRRIRARIRSLMAEQEACASAVTEALAAAGESLPAGESAESREEEEVTVTSSARRNSSEKTVSSTTTTKTSKVIESMTRPAPKPVSPFAKFRQLEKQNSVNSPKM